MIRVDRGRVPPPAALEYRPARGRHKGKTEFELILEALDRHVAAGQPREAFAFDYKRYREAEVRQSLAALFGPKCAYCETRYATSAPMDVEHWRPKGEIHDGDGSVIRPGYYWLAATWHNLLPSCIDCNRARKQFDVVNQQEELLGKANQFPLEPGSPRLTDHEQDPDRTGGGERPLLVNPCVDDPADHLRFDADGMVWPRTSRGAASIRVYALNRSELVRERRELARLVERRIDLIADLSLLRDEMQAAGAEESWLRTVGDLLAHEIRDLLAMGADDRPYAGMVRQLIAEHEPP